MSMMAARELVKALDAKVRDEEIGQPHFTGSNIHVFPLSKRSFRVIQKGRGERRMAFLDGGNGEIIGAPSFSVQLSRVYAGAWRGKERDGLAFPRVEFFSATFSTFREDQIFYDTVVVPADSQFSGRLPDSRDLSFNSYDRSVMNGTQRADIERVASIARRFAEWKYAAFVARQLERGDVLVVDGTLQTNFTNEGAYLEELRTSCRDRGVILAGLSKTTALFTTSGLSLLGAVDVLAEDSGISGEWYCPIAESENKDHDATILVVRLNGNSERVFRFEVMRDQFKGLTEEELQEILSGLVANSSDVTFPGYPYGLIEVDRLARVSTHEVEYHRGVVLSQISGLGKWKKFERHMRAADAHSVLNTLVG